MSVAIVKDLWRAISAPWSQVKDPRRCAGSVLIVAVQRLFLDPSGRCTAKMLLGRPRDAAWRGFATHPLVSSPELGRLLLEGYEAGHPQIAELFARG